MSIELFDGVLRFNPFLVALDALVLMYIVAQWYVSAKRTLWKIDFWHLNILLLVIIPILVQYPFAASKINEITIGENIESAAPYVDKAFLICIYGFISVLIGRALFDHGGGGIHRAMAIPQLLMRPVVYRVRENVDKTWPCVILCLMALPATIFIFNIAGGLENKFSLRDYSLSDPSTRAIINFTFPLISLVPLYFALRQMSYPSKINIFVIVSSCFVLILSGNRGTLLFVLLNIGTYWAYANYRQVSIKVLILGAISILGLAIILDALRKAADPGDALVQLGFQLFYANNFSELRDFAWFLSDWDQSLLGGKTELAGLMSFVPRFLSDFREEWSVGVVTAKAVGFSPSEHAGLRLSVFGESYINFGLVGVGLIGLQLGYVLRYSDCLIREKVKKGMPAGDIYAATIPAAFVISLTNTAGFAGFYSFIIINFFIFYLSKVFFIKYKSTWHLYKNEYFIG